MSLREKWNERYRAAATDVPLPCHVLSEFHHLLPQTGKALDLATGRGGNALFLAAKGLDTEAWDISSVALQQIEQRAQQQGFVLNCRERDIVAEPPPPASFDVIVVSRFLHRPLCPAIAAALRSGGLLFYQTFIHEKAERSIGPSNPDYLLQCNELLQLFSDLRLLAYREEGAVGDLTQGFRNEAWLVAMKV